MRRTQEVVSYVSLFLLLATGLVLLVAFLVYDGFSTAIHHVVFAALEINLAVIGLFGSVSMIVILLLIWRYQRVV